MKVDMVKTYFNMPTFLLYPGTIKPSVSGSDFDSPRWRTV